ncbi:hypothetical protein F511_00108 [Dorcoceras hygrometricum]|nr:hypothetical protein F511_00108 [Dorcoceras hygrometricum]
MLELIRHGLKVVFIQHLLADVQLPLSPPPCSPSPRSPPPYSLPPHSPTPPNPPPYSLPPHSPTPPSPTPPSLSHLQRFEECFTGVEVQLKEDVEDGRARRPVIKTDEMTVSLEMVASVEETPLTEPHDGFGEKTNVEDLQM